MNLFLHNIGEIDGSAPISPNDSLVADDGERYDLCWRIRRSAGRAP